MSRLRQLQDEGRLEPGKPLRERPEPRRHQSTLARPQRGARTFAKPETPSDIDQDVMAAAEHFLARSKAAGTLQSAGAFALHRVFLDRVEVSGLRDLRNYHNGRSMWPDILVTLVDVYWETEANPRNEWAWKHFVSDQVFGRILPYLLSKVEEAYDRAADTRTVEDKAKDRQANWDRIAERAKTFVRNEPVQRPTPKPVSEQRSDADVFEDDLEEWEALMAKKRAARSKEGS